MCFVFFSCKTKNWSVINHQALNLSSCSLRSSEAHSEPSQLSKMELSAKNNFQPLTTSTKNTILDDRLGSVCVSGQIYRLILHLYWPEHQKGLVTMLNGLMHLIKLIKGLCTKLVVSLMSYILNQIFKIK